MPTENFSLELHPKADTPAREATQAWINFLRGTADGFAYALEDPQWLAGKTWGEAHADAERAMGREAAT